MYWYNPIFNKVPEGPSQKNKVVTYTLKIAKQIGSTSAIFNCCKDYEDTPMRVPMKAVEFDNYIEYTASVKFETANISPPTSFIERLVFPFESRKIRNFETFSA